MNFDCSFMFDSEVTMTHTLVNRLVSKTTQKAVLGEFMNTWPLKPRAGREMIASALHGYNQSSTNDRF